MSEIEPRHELLEEAPTASERDLRLIVDSIPGMVAVFSAEGELQFVNNQVLEYFGATQEELKNWEGGGYTHPEDNARSVEAFVQSITTGKWVDHEIRARRFDGVYRWFQSRGHPLRDAGGRAVRWCNLLTDIDDRKHAESELRRVNQYLTMAQQLSQTGSYTRVMATDEQNLSDQMYRICEFDPTKKVTHDMVLDRIHPEDLLTFEAAWSAALEAKEGIKIAYRFVTDSGAVKHFRTISHPVVDAMGQLTYTGATQDVTEIKLVEEAANRARAELAHVARISALNALTASIAHEVNQPLAGIVTNANTCLRMLAAASIDLEGAKATAQRTLRDANRAAEVIKRLRTMFARKQPSMEPLDLNDAAREVLALSSSELQHRRVVARTVFAENMPVVSGDRVQLQQVVLNLILNAADAMCTVYETPRSLTVETRRHDTNRVCLSVRDCGVGIDPKNAEKMFDTFYTTKPEGMGIGLAISRSIIESHNGHLWATANQGPGATFTFSIPCGSVLASEIVKPGVNADSQGGQ